MIKVIQSHIGVTPDGIIGTKTLAALAKALGIKAAQANPISAKGIALIKQFEGLELKSYPDPGSGGAPWTIGIGTTVYPNGSKVKRGDVVTEAKAEEYLHHDLRTFESAVNRLTPITTQPQFDALVSFCYNVGVGNFEKSTLRRLHNSGEYEAAAKEFDKWVFASGKKLNGLVRRRSAEKALYRSGS